MRRFEVVRVGYWGNESVEAVHRFRWLARLHAALRRGLADYFVREAA